MPSVTSTTANAALLQSAMLPPPVQTTPTLDSFYQLLLMSANSYVDPFAGLLPPSSSGHK
ncbi:hypothetical protein Ciccas_008453 [Cichlidogyrus casuarinus]|uniref:Uncharacterized protein n=1 Tax=Cichlidogyrus casuarinus TaxID=1844966 RepID=A0ABD2PZX8_9PLAT